MYNVCVCLYVCVFVCVCVCVCVENSYYDIRLVEWHVIQHAFYTQLSL